jgi:chaperone required for assembly of F1-ATPase
MKRVYKTVAVVEAAEGGQAGWEVRLDGKPLRTPARVPMVLRSRPLVEAIAAEWDAQAEEVKPQTMPMTQLASTALDRVIPQRAAIVDGVAKYAETDLLCYRAEAHQAALQERQHRVWQPILDWAALRYDAQLAVQAGVMPRPQPAGACNALKVAVEALDDMRLTGLQAAVGACGSLVLGLALLENRITAEEAFEASQLDETFQIEQWGEDKEAKDRRASIRRDIAEARRFLDLVEA